ncbi:unnamed protein product [Mytilus edulis]|uniref:P/Homo B domain-containing protein n=1 Tax=Mytilus edulis TaxID=6550 RepID=A0A8S3S7I7_MYTED|nr:unnamed protein product [Mytilus edulis]
MHLVSEHKWSKNFTKQRVSSENPRSIMVKTMKAGSQEYGINVFPAWQKCYNGTGIVVAVVDTGVNARNADLDGQVLNLTSGISINAPLQSQHGTEVAGLIAAKANDQFGRGIAFGARIAGSPKSRFNIRCFSGNGGENFFADSCAYQEFMNNRHVILVAGVNHVLGPIPTGEKCSAIMVTAPTRELGTNVNPPMITTMGDTFTTNFGMTSAAVAIVSGSIAVLLSAKLTNIITLKIDPTCNIQYLEHVEVQLIINARGIGHSKIFLQAPGNFSSKILPGRVLDGRQIMDISVQSVQFWGHNPKGLWFIKIVDDKLDKTTTVIEITYYTITAAGIMVDVRLTLHGLQKEPETPIRTHCKTIGHPREKNEYVNEEGNLHTQETPSIAVPFSIPYVWVGLSTLLQLLHWY